MTESTGRGPSAGRRRRPIPALIFFLVLALAAMFLWWNVIGDEHTRDQAQAAACSSASAAPESLDPTTVTVRVLNASDIAGKAGEVTETLVSRSFVVSETANDNSGIAVTGVGELRFGPRGKSAAEYLQLFIPGATLRPDTRATAVVDVVIGPDFAGLASQDQVAAALAPAVAADGSC